MTNETEICAQEERFQQRIKEYAASEYNDGFFDDAAHTLSYLGVPVQLLNLQISKKNTARRLSVYAIGDKV